MKIITIDELEIDILEPEYHKQKEKYRLSSLEVDGLIYRFSRWLNNNGISYDDAEDVYNNTSCLRDGNRLDIQDSYTLFTDEAMYTIEYIWANKNGVMFATLYDKEKECWFGDIIIT